MWPKYRPLIGVSPDQEDDDGGDDEDQQEDGDTQRLLLIGRLQLTFHSASADKENL